MLIDQDGQRANLDLLRRAIACSVGSRDLEAVSHGLVDFVERVLRGIEGDFAPALDEKELAFDIPNSASRAPIRRSSRRCLDVA
jgi:hypothetical protein